MSKLILPPRDHNYVVDGLSPAIKAKITTLIHASADYAFAGAAHPDEAADIEEALQVARYNLERTIKTAIDRHKRKE